MARIKLILLILIIIIALIIILKWNGVALSAIIGGFTSSAIIGGTDDDSSLLIGEDGEYYSDNNIEDMIARWGSNERFGGLSNDSTTDYIVDKVSELMNTFINGRFTSELAKQMEDIITDIKYDITDITQKKLKDVKNDQILNTYCSKILLDSMLHFYIYNKNPNNISRKSITENTKLLNIIKPDVKFSSVMISNVIDLLGGIIKSTIGEQKLTMPSKLESFRTSQVLLLAGGTEERKKLNEEIENLKNELTQKSMELRDKELALRQERGRLKYRTSSLSNDILLEECQKERRQLQEEIYRLRRDLRGIITGSIGVANINTEQLRRRLRDCEERNRMLEQRQNVAHNACERERAEIRRLRQQLSECEQNLNTTLKQLDKANEPIPPPMPPPDNNRNDDDDDIIESDDEDNNGDWRPW